MFKRKCVLGFVHISFAMCVKYMFGLAYSKLKITRNRKGPKTTFERKKNSIYS